MIKRNLQSILEQKLKDGKVLVVLGPRQAGKTTLLRNLVKSNDLSALWWNGDETDIRAFLQNPTSTQLKKLIGSYRVLVIDEAQRIENIGLVIKLIYDNIPGVKVIATGSSAFELANRINEPLTGRKWEYFLYPVSFDEMVQHHGFLEEKRLLEQRLIYGYYPEVITNAGSGKETLLQLADSYLYKDILTWENVQKPEKLEKLIQVLAFQLGSEVSYLGLSRLTGIDKETVERYIMLLERAFVVFRLGAFSRNLRKELSKARKIYFYDNGIRNAVIRNYAPLALRQDTGALWENFLIAERMKFLQKKAWFANTFFWRTHDRQEIDYIEERDGTLYAFEFKWGEKTKAKFPRVFRETYPEHETAVINRSNFDSFIMDMPG